MTGHALVWGCSGTLIGIRMLLAVGAIPLRQPIPETLVLFTEVLFWVCSGILVCVLVEQCRQAEQTAEIKQKELDKLQESVRVFVRNEESFPPPYF
jgi:hypothetical protein